MPHLRFDLFLRPTHCALVVVFLLGACGGGTSIAPIEGDKGASEISFVWVDQFGAISNVSAVLDRKTNEVTFDDFLAYYDAEAGTIRPFDGQQYSLELVGEYSGLLDYESASGSGLGSFGVSADAVPTSGSVAYGGIAQVTIVEASNVFDLEGTAELTARFGAGSVDIAINDLEGISIGVDGTTVEAVSDVAEINISSAAIEGTKLLGGSVEVSGEGLSTEFSGEEISSHAGEFYGPNGIEVGGAVSIEGEEFNLIGQYAAVSW